MYGFVDTTETATNQGMSIQTVYNGINLDEALTDDEGSFTTLTVAGRGNLNRRINLIDVEGRDGSIETGNTTTDIRTPIIKFKITDKTTAGFRDRISRLKDMAQGNRLKLEFTDEEVFYYATLSELEIPEEESNDLVCTLTFICSDPYAYSNVEETEDLTDISTVNNEGNEAVSPIFELAAIKPATFAMVSNSADEYNLVGYPVDEDGHEEIVDIRPSIFFEDGRTLDDWATTGLKVDDYFNDITGSMTYDGGGIRAAVYGSSDRMHGPAVIKELPTSLQDFEIVTNIDIISDRVADNFRAEIYFFDESMNNLGKIGIKDNSRSRMRRVGMGRAGEYRGGGSGGGYVIGAHNYTHDDLGTTTLMNMSVKREGNLYTFYVARWRNNRHQTTLTSTYRDSAGRYGGRLKYIQIYLGSFKDRTVPRRLRVNNVEVFELKRLTVDQTPYILKAGDVVTFDHEAEEILINGEDSMRLKDFGADFFRLHSGYNQLTVSPEDTFETYLRYTNKYK